MAGDVVQKLLTYVNRGHRICTDSRAAHPDDLFFALSGAQFDGNQFARQALEAGCMLAVIDNPRFFQEKCLLVDDVLQTLQHLGAVYRNQFDIPLLAITGSNGKTTTKELTHAVLSRKFDTIATKGNLNNHIGVPLTLLSIPQHTQMGVIEMGANHKGEIAGLCTIARPTHGLITNIGKAHLEGFGNMAGVAEGKTELFAALTEGQVFLNRDDPWLLKCSPGENAIGYGMDADNHCSGQILKAFPLLEISFRVNKDFGAARKGMEGVIKSQLPGVYNVENIMAAITTGLYFGVAPKRVIDAIEGYHAQNHRSQLMQTKDNVIMMDGYNANPSSMEAALANFSNYHKKKLAVLLGDMLETGETAHEEHRKVIDSVKALDIPFRIFVGKTFFSVWKPEDRGHAFKDVDQALAWLQNNPLKGYTILVKGSRGIRMETLLSEL